MSLYARISLDRDGDHLGVDRQVHDVTAWCEAQGWNVVETFVDNDISATSGKARPAFERLLASRPQAIVCWHTDRLVRVTRDLERVIDLGVNVYALHAGHLDLSTPAGRAMARTITAWATYEGEQKATRQRASNAQRARAGLPPAGGPRPFGYTADGLEIVPDEAALIRAAYEEVIAGGSLKGTARRWNELGYTTTRGNAWTPSVVRRLLLNPRYAALRVLRGEIVGSGTWPYVVPEDTYRNAVAVMGDPTRRVSTDTRPRYLLTNIVLCGACGGRMATARTQHGARTYKCTVNGDLSRAADPIDAFITATVLARLARPDAVELLRTRPDTAALVREAEGVRARLDELAQAYALGSVTLGQLTSASETLRQRLEEVEARMAEHATATVLGPFGGADPQHVWEGLDITRRRAVVKELFSEIVLLSPGRGVRTFRPETVRVSWRAAS